MLKNETIMITGGTGYLGGRLLKKCLELNARVILLKRKSSKTDQIKEYLSAIQIYNVDETPLEEIFQENTVSTLLHCATDYSRATKFFESTLKTNILFPVTLLDLSFKYSVKTFINTDTFLDQKISAYALSKKQFLQWFKLYENEMACINMCLEYFYGPFDSSQKLLTYLVQELSLGKSHIDLTLGEQKRDFIYIDDVITAFEKVMVSPCLHQKGFHHFEVGTSQSISIKDLALMIKNLLKNTKTCLNFGAIPYRENEIFESHINAEPLKKLGWAPKINLEQGLLKMLEIENLKNKDRYSTS